MKKHFLISIIALTVSACGPTLPKAPQRPMSSVPSFALAQVPNTEVEAQLILTARSIESSLRTLAQASDQEATRALNTAVLITPEGGMGGRATIDWSGPVQVLVEKVAQLTQYELKVLGNEPPVPLVVSVTGQDVMIADILKDAGLQLRGRGDIVVYPNTKVIELRYVTI